MRGERQLLDALEEIEKLAKEARVAVQCFGDDDPGFASAELAESLQGIGNNLSQANYRAAWVITR